MPVKKHKVKHVEGQCMGINGIELPYLPEYMSHLSIV